MSPLSLDLQEKYQALQAMLAEMGDLIIGMSGGVDSVLLSKVAHDVLGNRALAVTADSPSLPRRELKEAESMARIIGIRHLSIKTEELNDPNYAANPNNRCYFCKSELFSRLGQLAQELGFRWLAYGENLDDKGDHRPGSAAADEYQVRAPLKEAALSKDDIRQLAEYLDLPVWDKPAFACLGSRFPYGSEITRKRLQQVEVAEDLLWELGFKQFRVRHHDDIARIEVLPEQVAKLVSVADRVTFEFKRLGYTYITMELGGYERGSMNKGSSSTKLHEQVIVIKQKS
ncbi:ATP-dependent sacrificial sulfur transferase LarE [Oceanospirillaceae bacterium]|jgi:uncharacterized protein|nr:ATP-dependent sacrificial sulfur transferase LarE [Oceanospirillaceae bacterium]